MRYRMLVTAAVLVFFLQALRVLFSTLFGIIYDQVFEGPLNAWLVVSAGLAFAAMLTPWAAGRLARPRLGPALALLAVAVRPLLTVNDATVRYVGALVVVAAGAGLLALELGQGRGWRALLWALLAEQVLRALGDTFDLSLQGVFMLPQIGLPLGLCALLIPALVRPPQEAQPMGGPGWAAGLGLGAFLFLETSLLALPAAAARWASLPYAPLALLMLAATAVPLVLRRIPGSPGLRAVLAVVLIGGVQLGYFAGGWLAGAGLVLAQACAVTLLAGTLGRSAPSGAGSCLAVGLLFYLLLNFANAFAFTYPYTLPAMRGMGWAVFGLASLALAAAALVRPPDTLQQAADAGLWGYAAVAAGLLLTIWAVRPLPVEPLPQGGTLRLANWNIHYGYDDVWHTTLPEIAAAIEANGVDAIAMQEVDAGRMTSYSTDNAYYLGRRLGMRVAYLPAVEHLTGIALLYKGDPAPVESMLLPSLQEQTGILRVRLPAAGGALDAHAIWLGLSAEDTLTQITAALDFIGSGTRASFGGDFNSEFEDPEIARVLEAGFADPFQLLGIEPAPLTDPAISPTKRIDFVFLRSLVPVKAWVPDSLASDHRMVVVEVATD